jgi:molybdopterin-containing oxidoreductase family iron-sulfur binding subunit
MSNAKKPDIDSVRRRLATATGVEYWRSLDELAGTEEFRDLLHREFPQGASDGMDPAGRRTFLKLMGASFALAGVTACTKQPLEKIVPYVKQPEDMVPGRPLFFATATTLGGYATGVLVESHEGRPTKVEGNPAHPASLGATGVFTQAAVLGLYDPDRSQALTYLNEIRSWGSFLSDVRSAVDAKRTRGGEGLRLLTGTVTSPTLASQIDDLLAEFPQAKWHQYDPAGSDGARAGALLAFGEPAEARYQIEHARIILSLDNDFLTRGPGALAYARAFAAGRRLRGGTGAMNRLYAVESTPSSTGAMADHRLPLKAAEIEPFARAVAAALGVAGLPDGAGRLDGLDAQHPPATLAKWIASVAADLKRHAGASLVIAGDEQPAAVHALVHAMNQDLGIIGTTIVLTEPVEARPVSQLDSIRELAADMDAGRVDLLVIVSANPVYAAPADLKFEEKLGRVAMRIHHGLYHDETAALCHWHVPAAHDLESWSDARAFDGTVTILQPLVAPLYHGKTAHELIGAFSKRAGQSSYDIVRAYWKSRFDLEHGGSDFEKLWRKSLHDGLVEGTATAPSPVTLKPVTPEWYPQRPAAPAGSLEVIFRPDPTIHDGQFANNGWLQELPKPFTKLTWDNAALMSPATAARLGVAREDVIEVTSRGRTLRAPVWTVPGQPHDAITVHLGYGRGRTGHVGAGAGFNAYAIRTAHEPWFASAATERKTGERYPLVSTQLEQVIDGRHLVRSATLEDYLKHPDFAREEAEAPPRSLTLYPEHEYKGYAWGMSIDVSACTGCNACVVACQSENNIPVVGKVEVSRGHKMQWLRVDRYHKGDVDNPQAFHQPVPCMQCENAPCEVVCPVGATAHSSEGLNDMTYNRCVGTRYCSNNCPYKVRRFNFFLYQDWNTQSLKLMRNPDVTVRSRGVMEKCTYCVQRINAAKITAEKENRLVRDGDIVTACEAACPSKAIVFGNINDKTSRVAALKADSLNYGLLEDLNTRPRTTYLAAVRNPNPDMPGDPATPAEPEK